MQEDGSKLFNFLECHFMHETLKETRVQESNLHSHANNVFHVYTEKTMGKKTVTTTLCLILHVYIMTG